jgi:hypothetical protein
MLHYEQNGSVVFVLPAKFSGIHPNHVDDSVKKSATS